MLPHRALPQPPKGRGFGAYHTKEAVLQRVQQQSGLLSGSRTNLNTLSGMLGSAINLAGIGANANPGATAGTPIEMSCGGVVGDCVGNNMGGELQYSNSNSNYNFDATTEKPAANSDVGAELKMTLAVTPACCAANPAPPTTTTTTNTNNTSTNVTNNLLYMDLQTAHPAHPKTSASVNKFSDLLNVGSASFANAVAAPAISANSNNNNSNNNHNSAIAAAVTLGNTGRSSTSVSTHTHIYTYLNFGYLSGRECD